MERHVNRDPNTSGAVTGKGNSMTKSDAARIGAEAGIAYAAMFTNDALLLDWTANEEATTDRAKFEGFEVTHAFSVDSPRMIAFMEAFVKSARTEFQKRRNALPEVQAEFHRKGIEYALESAISSANHALAEFRKRLDQDAVYAFEWADNAMQAAASLKATTWLQTIFNEQGADAMQKVALRKALEGARSPSHSTSTPSNLMAQYLTAAYAEFAGRS